ncbi:MAG: response regulator transcription factor [Clostridia bacterium]|nr:response regulator transcription factor [Clostridia bacterium]
MQKILIADDEAKLRRLIKDFLAAKGYCAVEAEDGAQALRAFESDKDIALAVLDIMMPEMNGWEVCRKIRETSDIPVIFLTARGEEFDELECFECGADDFISKPFSPSVLVKRIEARLKRSAGDGGTEKISLDGLVIDVVAHEVTCNGKPVELTHKEYCILHKLAANKDRVFSREQLLDDIWGFDFLGDSRTVDSHVARLRTKLGEWGSKHLRTVYGAGYKIEVN